MPDGVVERYLVLEDLALQNPAVCDVKLGFAAWHNEIRLLRAVKTSTGALGVDVHFYDWPASAKDAADSQRSSCNYCSYM